MSTIWSTWWRDMSSKGLVKPCSMTLLLAYGLSGAGLTCSWQFSLAYIPSFWHLQFLGVFNIASASLSTFRGSQEGVWPCYTLPSLPGHPLNSGYGHIYEPVTLAFCILQNQYYVDETNLCCQFESNSALLDHGYRGLLSACTAELRKSCSEQPRASRAPWDSFSECKVFQRHLNFYNFEFTKCGFG